MRVILTFLTCLCLLTGTARADLMSREALAERVIPPFLLGDPVNDKGVWTLENAGGQTAGYVFETEPLAPLPGFSGAPINVLVMLDLEGQFIDVQLIGHNEPIFVSGLGQAAFEQFFTQYRGQSISAPLVVGTPYGETQGSSALVYLDGVTKATASVRIAHESILAATLQVAREKMQGVSSGPPAFPDPAVDEDLTWQDLVEQGLATRHLVSNAEVNKAFAGTLWEDDDPGAEADPDGAYLDLWIVDIGPPSIARAVLDAESLAELQAFLTISDHAEPILLVETGRHGLITEEFVRNTAPDLVSAEQFGLPVALRDSDLLFSLRDDLPEALQDGTAMILRTDRRLGFDPTEPWTLHVEAVRAHGSFMPQVGSVTLSSTQSTDARFFARAKAPRSLPPWRAALRERQADMIALALGLTVLLPVLFWRQSALAGLAGFTPVRLGILAVMTGFVGWWGQGQLSIVTVIGVIRTAWEGGSYAFLLYDPFSLLVWGAAILGFVLWGRALFCGWLCPFGAMQEFAHHVGRLLRLPEVTVPARWDTRLKRLKYLVLAGLVALIFVAPGALDTAVEVEPFKTAVTTYFLREWYYVAYAVGLLVLSAVVFKGFCRYLCPLGALMALGGLLRGRDWIARRAECGSPCQLCAVRCKYQAIPRSGRVDYAECFGCLDCVKIHDDPAQCVPLVLKARDRKRAA
ncbi:4Fe-4S binding protein [Mameliella sp. CS4]|uniref:4Fe-4S binding protein n=1 Tax=Mameliella sp. CS4 TaxID=2862329 RepID=UPI001C5F00A1|nr:4Fe-4S binding protein [Mameliella sp. CS4]MBW4981199.1 4Fe-4S binding protein [Mameliella sp. CS4]